MQEKNEEIYSAEKRLNALRLKVGGNWSDVAREIGISESLIHAINNGRAKLTDKTAYRIREAERRYGIKAVEYGYLREPSPTRGAIPLQEMAGEVLEHLFKNYTDELKQSELDQRSRLIELIDLVQGELMRRQAVLGPGDAPAQKAGKLAAEGAKKDQGQSARRKADKPK